MNGIIPLFKPKGPTSHDCVFQLRKILGQKKIGHTGTLDPEVEGVLPICVGEGTKVIPFLTGHFKEYVVEMKLGASTSTEDATGEVIEKAPIVSFPDKNTVLRVLETFTGTLPQVPPMYSAVKVNGKKLYEYAREGKQIERPSRQVTIKELELLDMDEIHNRIRLRVLCSKGTYIRTLCVDIGSAFGYPAHMTSLVRTASDGIVLQETVDSAGLKEAVDKGEAEKYLLPVERVLDHIEAFEADNSLAKRVSFGQKLPLPFEGTKHEPFRIMHDGRLLAIYEQHGSIMKPVRVFNLNKRDGE